MNLRFERAVGRGVFAYSNVQLQQLKQDKVLVQGYAQIPFLNFALLLYLAFICLFLMSIFQGITPLLILLVIGFLIAICFISLAFINLQKLHSDTIKIVKNVIFND